LRRADFIFGDPGFLRDAKIVFHSGIATECHRGRQVQQHGRFGFEDRVVARRMVEIGVRFFLCER
jgi:hypothetical protein